MTAAQIFQSGKLGEAVHAALDEVRAHPTDIRARGVLCELLCFAGDLERADKQLDVLLTQQPDLVPGVTLFRQLIRAEQSRREFFGAGRVPEFLGGPTPLAELHLRASISIREGNAAEAAAILEQAEEAQPLVHGTIGGQPFEGIRDLDDLLAPFLEVLTSTGKYYWIPFDTIETLEFHAPESPRDLLWARAHLVVRGGLDGEVFVPALYDGSRAEADEALQLGRATDWRGDEGAPVRGVGQRTLLVGDADLPLLSLGTLEFEKAAVLTNSEC